MYARAFLNFCLFSASSLLSLPASAVGEPYRVVTPSASYGGIAPTVSIEQAFPISNPNHYGQPAPQKPVKKQPVVTPMQFSAPKNMPTQHMEGQAASQLGQKLPMTQPNLPYRTRSLGQETAQMPNSEQLKAFDPAATTTSTPATIPPPNIQATQLPNLNQLKNMTIQGASGQMDAQTRLAVEEWQMLKPNLIRLLEKEQQLDEMLYYLKAFARLNNQKKVIQSQAKESDRCKGLSPTEKQYARPKCD